jgi:membrane associated rhomboid family serine protease
VTSSDSTSSAIRSCYRHPGRETRLSCTSCGRPICVDCTVDASVGQKCPECAAPEGRHRVIDRSAIVGTRGGSPFTYALIAVNVLIFFAGQFDPELRLRLIVDFAQRPDLVSDGDWYRVISAMFLHGSITHILFNSWALWLFGPVIERRFGSASFLSLYLAAGIAGGAAYQVSGRMQFAVGASGAIFGLFGALLGATYRQRHTPAGRAVFSQLALLLGINLALPLFVPNIAWEAHLGGLAAGMILAAAWGRVPISGVGAAPRRIAVALAVAVVAAVVVLLG